MEKATQVVRQVCAPKFKVPDGEYDLIWSFIDEFIHFVTNWIICIIYILEALTESVNSGVIPDDKNFKVKRQHIQQNQNFQMHTYWSFDQFRSYS